MTSICGFLVLSYYLFQWEVNSSISLNRGNDLSFPSVTICNLNPVLYSKLNITDELADIKEMEEDLRGDKRRRKVCI